MSYRLAYLLEDHSSERTGQILDRIRAFASENASLTIVCFLPGSRHTLHFSDFDAIIAEDAEGLRGVTLPLAVASTRLHAGEKIRTLLQKGGAASALLYMKNPADPDEIKIREAFLSVAKEQGIDAQILERTDEGRDIAALSSFEGLILVSDDPVLYPAPEEVLSSMMKTLGGAGKAAELNAACPFVLPAFSYARGLCALTQALAGADALPLVQAAYKASFPATRLFLREGYTASCAAPAREVTFQRIGIPGEKMLVVFPVFSAGELTALLATGAALSFEEGSALAGIAGLALESVRQSLLLRTKNRHLTYLYTHDALTRLHNRFALEENGRSLYEALQERDGAASLWFVDVDHLKYINDTFGHEVGDQMLEKTAAVIDRLGRSFHLFTARFGGDEFVLLGRRSTGDLSDALRGEISKIRLTMPEGYSDAFADPSSFLPTVSVGRYDADGSLSFSECLAAADKRMYERKRSGRQEGSAAC